MLEKGHFEELRSLLELINSNQNSKKKRQTFVFSATLALTHDFSVNEKIKFKAKKETKEMKIGHLIDLIGIKPKPKIVDLTQKFVTAEMLSESKIFSDKEQKDNYLYYILKRHPGRTLVFCNSISCIRRLANLLTILKCQPQTLHASKIQKQRLKNLERFSKNESSVLLATDVAARGLDIPGIDHIVHYEVPRTAEIYVHRSGRTARASREGLSIVLVDTSELPRHRQLCRNLNRSTDLPDFPVDFELMKGIEERVSLAKEIENMEHGVRKKKRDKEWLHKMAKEAEVELGESDNDDDDASQYAIKNKQNKQTLQAKKMKLNAMLAQPLLSSSFSGRYPTKSGKLIQPCYSFKNEASALNLLKTKKPKLRIFPEIHKAEHQNKNRKKKRQNKKKLYKFFH